jgi:hypothetical protein
MLTISGFLLFAAFVCFLLAAFGATVPRVNLTGLGLALWVLSLLLAGRV